MEALLTRPSEGEASEGEASEGEGEASEGEGEASEGEGEASEGEASFNLTSLKEGHIHEYESKLTITRAIPARKAFIKARKLYFKQLRSFFFVKAGARPYF
jgi:hypothetical protein